MARSWSGFLPQNQIMKAKWQLMEAGEREIADFIDFVSREHDRDRVSEDEEEGLPLCQAPKGK
jgi:hypothetical protein